MDSVTDATESLPYMGRKYLWWVGGIVVWTSYLSGEVAGTQRGAGAGVSCAAEAVGLGLGAGGDQQCSFGDGGGRAAGGQGGRVVAGVGAADRVA